MGAFDGIVQGGMGLDVSANASRSLAPTVRCKWCKMYKYELKETAVRENTDRRCEAHSNLQRRHTCIGGFIINKLITLLPFRVFALTMRQMTPLIRNYTLRKSTDLVNRTLCFI